jgi:hypothetical protein
MPSLFAKVFERMDSAPLEAVADTLSFETIDPAILADRLELERHGNERRGLSAPEGVDAFDSIEHTILTEIEEYRRRAVDRMTMCLEAYASRLQAFDFAQARLEIVAAIHEAKTNFIAEVHQGKTELFSKRRAVIDATNDLDAFRQQHSLLRQAHLPDTTLWIWGIVTILFLIEMAINASLFAGGLAGGFLEGFSLAAGVAFLNVALGFAVGLYVARFLLYKTILYRLLALLGLLIDLSIAAMGNLAVARFRTALGSPNPEAAVAAVFDLPFLEMIGQLPGITGFQSYILLGVGVLFHYIAMFDGFKLDDPYPFYGKYWRKRNEAEDEYLETKEGLIEYLTTQRDESISDMRDAASRLSASRNLAARIVEYRAQTYQRFETYLDNLERIANQLIVLYREAKGMGTLPVAWRFPNRNESGAPWRDIARLDPQEEKERRKIAARTQEDIEAGIADISEKYIEAVTTYEHIAEMLSQGQANGETQIASARS